MECRDRISLLYRRSEAGFPYRPVRRPDRWFGQSQASLISQRTYPSVGPHNPASFAQVRGSKIGGRIGPDIHARNASRRRASGTISRLFEVEQRSELYFWLQQHGFEKHQSLPFERMDKLSQAQSEKLISLIFIIGNILIQALLETLSQVLDTARQRHRSEARHH